ncbi:glycosyltransferase [Frigidibacter sp.]|uniref:glycosyltransferase n=1 Tax=Frigidibacter sp. TaxID=2586418 RepID=UPI002733C3A8|nr:glycosyltransferase [Frigidibacter sp.]MDP3340494.1 glycosyltransferase [Frigidibacter sp.]
MQILGHILYLLVLVTLLAAIPATALAGAEGAILVLGVIGLWRYSWAAINFSRALWYQGLAYPRLRRKAEAAYGERARPAHAYFLVTSYKIDPEVTSRVYRSVFEAAASSAGGATVVASVVDGADLRLVRSVFSLMRTDMSRVRLLVDQIPATGKRDALAKALRIITRQAPSWRDIVILVDGDSCVPADIVARSAPFFCDPAVGALTTDESVEITDAPVFRDWFALRFTQRQMMMSSMGLSGRVLTLTGRMSVFRADLATDPGFIRQVQSDYMDHWRLGRVDFLTGDDKSTWFWLLKNGYRMLYLPDVQTVSMERQPLPGFIESAVTLMVRWFGNMMRTNGRALALPASRIGVFTWWSLLDQRVSVWTTLAGPLGVLLTAILVSPGILPVYLAWIMATRYGFCMALSLFRGGGFPISYPILLYFGQITGAAVKTFVMFRLDRQRWTRQSISAPARPRTARLSDALSSYVHVLSLGWLTLGVLFISGLL